MRTSSGARHEYAHQAARYDRTRGASPSIVAPVLAALDGANRKVLLDLGGGTGNYAVAARTRGYRPVVVDVSPEMLTRAATKGLLTVRADVTRLPIATSSVDAAMFISMLHQVDDWRTALAEARRVLRPGGRLALMTYTRENVEESWMLEYFPSMRERLLRVHQTVDELLAELPGAEVHLIQLRDLDDASLHALARHPRLILEQAWRDQTSFFERLASDDPAGLIVGLQRLRADLDAGAEARLAERRLPHGDGVVIAWST